MKIATLKLNNLLLVGLLLVTNLCNPDKTKAPSPVLANAYVEILNEDATIYKDEIIKVKAQFVNEQNEVSNPTFLWRSSNFDVLSIDEFGVASAKAVGQAYVYALFGNKQDSILINILPKSDTLIGNNTIPGMTTISGIITISGTNTTTSQNLDENIASIVVLSPSGNELLIGNTIKLIAKVFNASDIQLNNKVVTWESSVPSVAFVDETGKVSALSIGTTNLIAKSEGKSSISIKITVMGTDITTLSGIFSGKDGHSCSGAATEFLDGGNNIKIAFGTNFSCTSGPDLRVFLANSESGGNVLSSGLELALLKSSSGAQVYNVPSTVKLGDYKYVVVHCKQYNVTFGSAELK